MDEMVSSRLADLRRSTDAHLEMGKFILSLAHYPLDYWAASVLNRSLALISGFATLIEARNFVAAVPLLRLQLDTWLRFSAAWLVVNPHELAVQVLAGV